LIQRGSEPPAQATLFGWLVREAEVDAVITAPGHELGVDGVALALPLRRENSALAGFLVFVLGRKQPAFVADAIAATLDDLGLAFAPQLDTSAAAAPQLASVR
jgi:hypothetical protein